MVECNFLCGPYQGVNDQKPSALVVSLHIEPTSNNMSHVLHAGIKGNKMMWSA